MARKEPAKGVHTSPDKAGAKNMPENMSPDDGSMEHILVIMENGDRNGKAYKGLWTEESLKTEIQAFFNYCFEKSVKPSKAGLATWLGTFKQTLWEWETKPEKYGYKSDLMKLANQAIEISYIARSEKYPTANIFLLKSSHGHQDTTKVDINTNITNVDEVKDMVSKLGLDK